MADTEARTTEAEKTKDLPEPYWQCICGTKAYPLTDYTPCDCHDIYEQEWNRVPPWVEDAARKAVIEAGK